MSKPYLVSHHPAPGYEAAIHAASYLNPLDDIREIEKTLSSFQVEGAVILDLLLTNGNKRNRFYVATFDGNKFKDDGFSLLKNDQETISNFSACFLKNHLKDLDSTLLTPPLKFALSEGIPL